MFSSWPLWIRVSLAQRARLRSLPGSLICLLTLVTHGQETTTRPTQTSRPELELRAGETVAFVGGADVAAAQQTGHLETLLTLKFAAQKIHCRNLGWEGDTVFAQPRDTGFPPLGTHLERARASVVLLQFGRTEALQGWSNNVPQFLEAYRALLDTCQKQTPRLVLIAPPPFETGTGLLPDLARRNPDLRSYVNAIRQLANERQLPLIDLFAAFEGETHRNPSLTENGLQFSARGHGLLAEAVALQLGWQDLVKQGGGLDQHGAWSNPRFEQVRRLVVQKNQLWFNYWRPQNWAFLGGDRTSQPSSRDHRDPSVRWFPAEMDKFMPLIEAKETEITELSGKLLP